MTTPSANKNSSKFQRSLFIVVISPFNLGLTGQVLFLDKNLTQVVHIIKHALIKFQVLQLVCYLAVSKFMIAMFYSITLLHSNATNLREKRPNNS